MVQKTELVAEDEEEKVAAVARNELYDGVVEAEGSATFGAKFVEVEEVAVEHLSVQSETAILSVADGNVMKAVGVKQFEFAEAALY